MLMTDIHHVLPHILTKPNKGINYCLVKQLLERNCSVLIADLALRPEAEELVKKYTSSPKCLFIKTDVTDWKQLQHSIDQTVAEFGGLDIVGPGAGIFEEPWSNFWIPCVPLSQSKRKYTKHRISR